MGGICHGSRLVRARRLAADVIRWNHVLLSCFFTMPRGRDVRTTQDKRMKQNARQPQKLFFYGR